jgi:hypothetical protein
MTLLNSPPPTLAQRLDWLIGEWRLKRDDAAAMRREVREQPDDEERLELILRSIDAGIVGMCQILRRVEARQMTEANPEATPEQFALELEVPPRTHDERMRIVDERLGPRPGDEVNSPQLEAPA